MRLSQAQISDLEELECLFRHAADLVVRSRLGNKTQLSDRAVLLLLGALKTYLAQARRGKVVDLPDVGAEGDRSA